MIGLKGSVSFVHITDNHRSGPGKALGQGSQHSLMTGGKTSGFGFKAQ